MQISISFPVTGLRCGVITAQTLLLSEAAKLEDVLALGSHLQLPTCQGVLVSQEQS